MDMALENGACSLQIASLDRSSAAPRMNAVDEGAEREVALAEAVLGVADEKVVGHAAAEPLVTAARIQAEEVIAV